MNFVLVLVDKVLVRKGLNEIAYKSPGPCGWIEDFDILGCKSLSEMLVQKPIRTFDNELHYFVRRVNYAQLIGSLGIVCLVEILIDDFQELLLFMVAHNAGGMSLYPLIVVLDMI